VRAGGGRQGDDVMRTAVVDPREHLLWLLRGLGLLSSGYLMLSNTSPSLHHVSGRHVDHMWVTCSV